MMAGVVPSFFRLRGWWCRNRFFVLRDFCLGLFIISLTLFWVGYHNADSGQNLRWINAEYDLELSDMTLDGSVWDSVTGYRVGMTQMLLGFVWGFFSFGSFCWYSCMADNFRHLPPPPYRKI